MTDFEMYIQNKNYIVNVTEIRGTPLIIVDAYTGFLLCFIIFIMKIFSWIFKPMCKKNKNIPTLEATPINNWLNNVMNTPTSRSSHSTFEPSEDSEGENDVELAPRNNAGRDSDG